MMHRIALISATIATLACADAGLLGNGDFQTDADKDGKPDGWALPTGASLENEGGNRFLRLTGAGTSTQVAVFRELPAGAAKAVRVSFRIRCTDIKRGAENWHDARVVMEAKDAQKATIKGAFPHLNFKGSTNGWVEKSFARTLPDGTATITIMPALFMVESGTFDIDDIKVAAIDPAEVPAAK